MGFNSAFKGLMLASCQTL